MINVIRIKDLEQGSVLKNVSLSIKNENYDCVYDSEKSTIIFIRKVSGKRNSRFSIERQLEIIESIQTFESKIAVTQSYHEGISNVNDLITLINNEGLTLLDSSNGQFCTLYYQDDIAIMNVVSSYNNEKIKLTSLKKGVQVSDLVITLHNGILPIVLETPTVNEVIRLIKKELKKYQ